MSDVPSSQPGSDHLAPPTDLDAVVEVIVGEGNGAPTDDAPTIISKNLPLVAKPKSTGNSQRPPESILGNSVRGRTLAHFELIEPIGVGGMAAVLRARDKQLDRCVALKILPPEMSNDPENVARFHQEARAAAKLDHENIARVYFCGEDQRLHFIAFEFVEGNNLRTLLERRGRLTVPEAVHYLLQIAAGLAHAAARGVVHRDIKPSNIIISPNGRAKLVDMGLARNMEKQAGKDLTQSGVTLGTFDYISPEQALEPRDADVRSDIYSLGCTFYHMLTGQPPVPEGTAAKKLHHHQHVAPIDPRQLNREIPDEVAVILAQMMAKDPKDRYQRAEHLVQHLIQVAQRLGAIADLPDGVLFVDAPLATPPQRRPWLMATIAALALVLLLLLRWLAVSQGEMPNQGQGERRDVSTARQLEEAPTAKDPPATQGERRDVSTARQLEEALTAKDPPATIVLQKNIVLPPGGLVFHGGDRAVTIESRSGKPLTLSFSYQPGTKEGQEFRAGLTVHSGELKFHNIRLEVETAATPNLPVAGVMVENSASVSFKKCIFTQKTPQESLLTRPELIPVASVAGWNPKSPAKKTTTLPTYPPELQFEECLFERGQTALALTGTAFVDQKHCAFGPHGTLFHFRGKNRPGEEGAVNLLHVSAHLLNGPAFRFDDGRTCKLEVRYSLFAGPDARGNEKQRLQPDFILQTATPTLSLTYIGQRNGYYGLHGFWMRPVNEGLSATKWEEFQKEIARNGGRDDDSLLLPVSPWSQTDPIAFLPGSNNPAFDVEEMKKAFQVKLSLPGLRLNSKGLVGVEYGVWGPTYDKDNLEGPPAAALTVQLKENERLFDPSEKGRIAGVYSKLSAALEEAKTGDVILIKYNGPLTFDPVMVRGDRRVLTLKPYPKCKPILTLTNGKRSNVSAAMYPALFEIFQGELHFDQLTFQLKMPSGEYGPLAVVALTGNGACYFTQCQVTMETDTNAPLCAVAIYDSRDLMKLGGQPLQATRPKIDWKNSMVRGEGNFLCVKGSRPFDLSVEQSLVAVSGSLINADPNPSDVFAETGPVATVRLNHVTALVLDGLLRIRAGKTGKGAVKTEVEANHSLLAGSGVKTVAMFNGVENDDFFRLLFNYKGEHNAYCGFDRLAETFNSELQATSYKLETLPRFANEEEGNLRQDRLPFTRESFDDKELHQVTSANFQIKEDLKLDLKGYGVALDQLPAPAPGGTVDRQPQGDDEQPTMTRSVLSVRAEPINRAQRESLAAGKG